MNLLKFCHKFLKVLLKKGETHSPPRGLGLFLYTARFARSLTHNMHDYTCNMLFTGGIGASAKHERVNRVELLTSMRAHLLRYVLLSRHTVVITITECNDVHTLLDLSAHPMYN